MLICLQCCLHQYKTLKAVAKATAAIVLLSPPPSEFCIDEKNIVIRSAMDALRNSKKISLLAVAILFLFTFFNLILDAPRTSRFHKFPQFKIVAA